MPEPTKIEVLDAMKQYGGAFVSRLAEAWYHADNENEFRLRVTFSEYYNKYKQLVSDRKEGDNT